MYEDIKTACLYVRFSSHNQTERSIEGQTRVCRDFCKRHNIRIVEIYADRATSASKDIEKRVQFLKMIKDSEKGLFDAVIVYKLDRFARSRYDSATYKYRLKRNGVQLISATENISNDPEGIILESVLEGMAEFYSAELSQKINRGMRESAYKHNSIGGAVPLGYKIEDKKLVIDPKTAPIVKEAFEKYADGETVAEICRQFNARGYKTSKGTAFGKSSFTKIFRNERYIGVYTFHDYRAEDAIPAIIDKDLWDRVQLRVGKIKNAPARNKAKVVYLLSGKIFCGHCGSKMNGNCNAGNYCYYQCYGKKNGNVDCKKKNIRKEFIERLVAQDALSLLTDEYIEQIATIACEKNQNEIELDSALPTIRDRIHQVDLSLNNLLKAIESGSAPDMLVKRMGELEKEKKDLQAQAKKESEDIIELDKAQVIYWLEQFRGGSIEDEEFCRMLIDLFVNSVTVWDEDDNTYKVTVAYNLTSLPTKTYRLNKGGTLLDFASNAPGGAKYTEQHNNDGGNDALDQTELHNDCNNREHCETGNNVAAQLAHGANEVNRQTSQHGIDAGDTGQAQDAPQCAENRCHPLFGAGNADNIGSQEQQPGVQQIGGKSVADTYGCDEANAQAERDGRELRTAHTTFEVFGNDGTDAIMEARHTHVRHKRCQRTQSGNQNDVDYGNLHT